MRSEATTAPTTEVHVYGVLAADDPAEDPPGTRRIVRGDLAAVVAKTEGGTLSAARAVRQHWRVLERIAAQTTVLPIRFGTIMANEDAVAGDFLAAAGEGLRSGLEALAGKVQFTVKGTYEGEALLRGVVERSPEVARLKAEIARLPEAASYPARIRLGELVAAGVERQRERDGALVLERLAPLAVATRSETASGLDGAVNAAFLVERDGLEAFGAAAAALAGELEGRIALRSIGPLPAYSFTPEVASSWA
jgi:Gas vesicle synthesis protein GvpL/GvpF